MLLKKLLANLIDTVLFWLIYFACFVSSGLPIDEGNSSFLLFLSFVIVIVLPVIFISNTFGKVITRISWNEDDALMIKLLVKYLIYFAALSPSLRISSALDGLIHGTSAKTASVVFADGFIAVAFIVTDISVFILSLGKYHIIDYVFKLTLKNNNYERSSWKILGMAYLFTAVLLGVSAFFIKSNFLPHRVEDHLKSVFYKEQFPSDRLYGSPVLVSKDYTNHVFIPSEPASFLFDKKYDQKTVFINLPYDVFQSLEARMDICTSLLSQSFINDAFGNDAPRQVRIVLSSIRMGRFLNYYNYYRIYYYDGSMPDWGIYGGIKADSSTTRKYVNFLNSYFHNKTSLIERQLKMPMKQILSKIKTDRILERKFYNQLNLHFKYSWTTKSLNIQLDDAKMRFEKINFDDSPLYGNAQINFPVNNVLTDFNFNNILADRIQDADDNVFTLIQVRQISNNYLIGNQ